MTYRLAFTWMCVAVTLSPVAGQNEQALSIVDVPRAKPITDEFFRLPIDESLGLAIDASISDLKSPHYATRSKAVEDLVQVGTPALARLRRAYKADGDLEVKLAIGDVVRRAYFNHHVYDRNGFLGINMRAYSYDQRKSEHDRALRVAKTRRPVTKPIPVPPLLPDHIVGVEVRKLTPDTAATRAGLEVHDVIFEVDGKRFSAEANTLNVLSAAIRSHRPGERVTLTIQRGHERKIFNVTLGRTPTSSLTAGRSSSRIVGTADLYEEVADEFPRWWKKHFEQQEHGGGSD